MDRITGLSLFSGIGGIDLALMPWVRTIAYCEQDRYAQGVLLSRMQSRELDRAPVWDDVRTLRKSNFGTPPDIIFGGFPCQDISVAGLGKGLGGERSGLFFEILRLAEELKPSFIFLENVPAIRTRGCSTVVKELSARGYDCRWCVISAQEVGANHKRERWFLLAHTSSTSRRENTGGAHANEAQHAGWPTKYNNRFTGSGENVAHAKRKRAQVSPFWELPAEQMLGGASSQEWWSTEPAVGRVAHGVRNRVDRIKCLGNAVVPLQAREAFKELMGVANE